MRLSKALAESFADDWIQTWNSRDLDAILAHYSDDIVFHSPGISRILGDDVPSVRGKVALRNYWSAALLRLPDLHFELQDVRVGSDALTILYRNERNQEVAETCVFDPDQRVYLSIAAYA
ncbi:MAG: nuclear transport factor 2 family protein [Henriciella sp.]|nr:nuclear transport factor 2 family protein [Henriciella sp.]